MRILIADADRRLAGTLARELRRHRHEVRNVADGAAATAQHRWADLVLIDTDLPDVHGIEVCRQIRASGETFVIMMSTVSDEADLVLGLQAGSDDYVVKPYGTRELLARIEAVTRRVRLRDRTRRPITLGTLRIDPTSHEVRLDDRSVAVTQKEFGLLYLLASKRDEVVPRRQIMSVVWNNAHTPSNSRTIDAHVNTLRRKLGGRDWIVTVRGVGFRMGEPLRGRAGVHHPVGT